MTPAPNKQRLSDLLADRALGEITDTDQAELRDLILSAAPGDDLDALDRVAVAIELSVLGSSHAAMPESLQARLKRDGEQFFEQSKWKPTVAGVRRQDRRIGRRLFIGALVAVAAAIVFLLFTPLNPFMKADPATGRLALLSAPGTTTAQWTSGPDPLGQHVAGDVVWNQSKQAGYLRFTGLPKNDPSQSQYQLWIFDENQDARYPIDGGVFNIAATSGDVVIPITPKLRVSRATMFAISVEKPGGVVVSDRKHLPAIAKVS